MPLTGIRRFLLIVRINSLINFDDNHFDILDPFDPITRNKTAKVVGTLSLPNKNDISDYKFYRLNENQKMIFVGPLYIPNPNEIVILTNKSIDFVVPSKVNDFIIRYLSQYNTKRFLDNVAQVTTAEIDPLDEFEPTS